METHWQKMHCAIHFISWKDAHTKANTLNALGQKHQVVHDHYSFWNLKTTGSSTEVQLFRVCPCRNEGSLASFAFWFSTSTISMFRLPKVSTMSTITSSSLHWIISGLMKPTKRNEELSGGMSIFALSLFSKEISDPLLSLFLEKSLPLLSVRLVS